MVSTSLTDTYDVIVIGAGAAGLMCAAEAGKRGRRVLVLESTDSPGKKILISGGGRCNFTNTYTGPENYLCSNPHFVKSALARYTAADFIELVEAHKIPYHEKKLGQLFCDRSARDILDMLLAECRRGNVRIVLNCRVTELRERWTLDTTAGEFAARALVIASGGLSIPKLGASSFGYDLARRFGIKVVPPRPALVPLVFNNEDRAAWCDLAGVAAESVAQFAGESFQEKLLITHKGLSGPAVLQISSYWDGRSPITFELLEMPRRLAARRRDVEDPRWIVTPAGTEGFEKAEVTAGGVHPDELSSKTMEARRVPGLFFIGEVVDVTGHLGGFNFQWAWSSGYAAAQAVAAATGPALTS